MDRLEHPLRLPVVALLFATTLVAGCSGGTGTTNSASVEEATTANPAPPADSSDPPSAPEPGVADPSVSLMASDLSVAPGGDVVLSWNAQNATACRASGGWSGDQDTRGDATVGPLDVSTTFTLTCSGENGSAMAMLSVAVIGTVTLDWTPPTENVDGTPLTDLAGYRIYYGQFSGQYTDELRIANANMTQHAVDLPSGDYYFAMTAMDVSGNESDLSNEVLKIVN